MTEPRCYELCLVTGPYSVMAGNDNVLAYLNTLGDLHNKITVQTVLDGTVLRPGQTVLLVQFPGQISNTIMTDLAMAVNRPIQLSSWAMNLIRSHPVEETTKLNEAYPPIIAASHWNSIEKLYTYQGGLRHTNANDPIGSQVKVDVPSVIPALPEHQEIVVWKYSGSLIPQYVRQVNENDTFVSDQYYVGDIPSDVQYIPLMGEIWKDGKEVPGWTVSPEDAHKYVWYQFNDPELFKHVEDEDDDEDTVMVEHQDVTLNGTITPMEEEEEEEEEKGEVYCI